MLNPTLQLPAIRAQLKADGYVVIDDFLQAEVARDLLNDIQRAPFQLAVRSNAGEQKLTPNDPNYAPALAAAADFARHNYGFAYEAFHLITAYQSQALNRFPALKQWVEIINSPGYLDFMRGLTGLNDIQRCDAQATRYRAGHFLRRHNDHAPREGRLAAYVMNLSQEWPSDAGGLLQIERPQGLLSIEPKFNRMVLFKIPTWHHVSPVANFAAGERLAITGWLRSLEGASV